jgi:hypothetical protein
LLRPEWSQPTLSAQEIRTQSGVLPAPVPVIPTEFTIQLYNPDSQVTITEKSATFGSNSYSFGMPQYTFRTPSGSKLDMSTNDPTADPTTPLVKFTWKKESKLSATNFVCYLTGRSTDINNSKKKGGREPDIQIAMLENGFKDLTFYESNYHRVEMEDYKGLEVVILLSAAVLRDIYCGQRKDSFNTGEAPRKNSAGSGLLGKKKSTPMLVPPANIPNLPPRPGSSSHTHSSPVLPGRLYGNHGYSATTSNLIRPNTTPPRPPTAPSPDPRAQWEIDAETARLRRASENEARIQEQRRRERERAEEAERKRLKKMLDQEEKERRKKQEEIDKETERLKKMYGDQSGMFTPQAAGRGKPQHGSSQSFGGPAGGSSSNSNNPYGRGAGIGASMSSFFHASPQRPPQGSSQGQPQQPQGPKKRKSFFGLRGLSEDGPQERTLSPKKSSMF